MKHILYLLLVVSFSTTMAQEKQFTLDELTPGGKNYQVLRPKRNGSAAWMNNKLVINTDDQAVVYSGQGKREKKSLLSLADLNAALKAAGQKELTKLPTLSFHNNGTQLARFHANNTYYWYDVTSKKIQQHVALELGDRSVDFNPQQDLLALCNGSDLYIVDENGKRTELSANSPEAVVWGQSVHRNEFGIHKGTFWSPDGKKLAFYRMDESMVTSYPLVNVSARVAEEKAIRYPMAGMDSHQVTVGIYDTETGETKYLATGEPLDRYFTNLSWTPDSESLLIAEVNRAQNEMNMVRYDIHTGKALGTLFTEKHAKYVEPEAPAVFLPDNEDQFLWLSKKDGYSHIYLYDLTGKEIKQMTQGDWVVKKIQAVDPKGRYVYYTSTEESPIEHHLYRLDMKSGKHIGLTTEHQGVHSAVIDPTTTYFFDRYSNTTTPNVEWIGSCNGKKEHTILEAGNPVVDYDMPEIVVGTIKAADGVTDLYYRLTVPTNFDASKKYPAIIYLYNGPHAQLVTDNWQAGSRGWDIYMAQKGYVMLTVDGRGSANRGQDFEQAIHWNLGVEEGKDQMQGIALLKELGYVDMDRIGIHGWSYGGFMTTHMMLTYPDVFKVGVAGGPVIDWKYYEIMYGERYMGHPEANKAGYASTSLLPKVGNLKGRLLMIHGDMDPVVVMQHSLDFMKRCVEERVYPDYFIYPGHEHNVIGIDRVHLHEKITRYFEDFL